MKFWKILLFSVVMLTNKSFSYPKILDEIVAIVNTDAVLKSDIEKLIAFTKFNSNWIDQKFIDESAIFHYQVLERLITNQIVLQVGKKMGITMTDAQLNQIIKNIAEQNSMNLSQMKFYLKNNNISYATYRDQIRKEILISLIVNNAVHHRIKITSQEVEKCMKKINNQNGANTKYNLDYILIPLPKKPTLDWIAKSERLAHSILNRANNGEDFAKLASIYAVNQKMLRYGKTGWKRIQDFPLILSQMLSTVKTGDVIGPIHSNAGIHILKVNNLYNQDKIVPTTEFHIRHILLKPSSIMNNNQAYAMLQRIATDIRRKKISFSYAAKQFSQDINSNNYGGDLGWLTISTYDPIIYNVLTKMKKGQMSNPIHSSLGWQLIELLDTRKTDKTVLQKEQVYQILFNQKFSKESMLWIAEQRDNTYVKILKDK